MIALSPFAIPIRRFPPAIRTPCHAVPHSSPPESIHGTVAKRPASANRFDSYQIQRDAGYIVRVTIAHSAEIRSRHANIRSIR